MGFFDSAVKFSPIGLIPGASEIIKGEDGGGGLGGLFADALTGGAYSTQQANAANVRMNKENRDWSERMSNTAYQRAMDDMRAAGLNPMLAYQQGGASTPSNSAPTITPAKMGAGLANSAKDMVAMNSNLNNQKADTILKAESAETQVSQRNVNNATSAEKLAQAQESNERAKTEAVRRQQIWSQKFHTDASIPGAQADSDERKMDLELRKQRYNIDKNAQKIDAIIDRAAKIISPINSAKSLLRKPNSYNDNYSPSKDVRDTMNSNHPKSPFRRK